MLRSDMAQVTAEVRNELDAVAQMLRQNDWQWRWAMGLTFAGALMGTGVFLFQGLARTGGRS